MKEKTLRRCARCTAECCWPHGTNDHLKNRSSDRLYADKGKVKGIDQDPAVNQEIYNKYVEAFQKGVFNMIKEDVDRLTNEVMPRQYFSGGMNSYKDVNFAQATAETAEKDFAIKTLLLWIRLLPN